MKAHPYLNTAPTWANVRAMQATHAQICGHVHVFLRPNDPRLRASYHGWNTPCNTTNHLKRKLDFLLDATRQAEALNALEKKSPDTP